MNERELSKSELKKKERIVKSLKKKKSDFKDRYGKDYKSVMYGTATNLAKLHDEHGAGEDGTDELRQTYEKETPGQEKKMKFKDFRVKISEINYPSQPGSEHGEQHDEIMYLEQPQVIHRLNAMMRTCVQQPSLDVWQSLAKVRVKLNVAGFDFKTPTSGVPQDVEEYQLTHFGGRSGIDDNAEMINDDGIVHRTGANFIVRVTFTDTDTGYMISPSIHKIDTTSEELDEGKYDSDKRIPKMSDKGKELLAWMANSFEETGGPYLDKSNVHNLTTYAIDRIMKKLDKLKNHLPSDKKKEVALVKKELDESVEDSKKKIGIESVELNEGKIEAVELELFITSDADLYRSRLQPIYKNLVTKMAQGKYDHKLAVKGFMYAVDEGAKKYAKEFASTNDKWNDIFDKKTRLMVAEKLADSFKDEADLGNYDNFLPKKYR